MKRIALIFVASIAAASLCVLAVAVRDRQGGSNGKQTPGMSLAFDAAEAEFKALTPILAMSVEDRAQAIIRERLIVCVMIMQHCVDADIVVTRERPSDGFEHRNVTKEWIRKYIDQTSEYPEWKDRNRLVVGVLAKVSG
jgi:hypothetical protein